MTALPLDPNAPERPAGAPWRLACHAILFVFVIVLFRTAWIGDDARITFRTVDNFVEGHGLRWNVAERVQSYTHPLWMMLLVVQRFITGEISIGPIVLSIALSAAAMAVVAHGVGAASFYAVAAALTLLMSRAFVDYSTSGLENPLSHLLLAGFFLFYYRRKGTPREVLILSLLLSLIAMNRLDHVLIAGPVWLAFVWRSRNGLLRSIPMALLGALPFLAWEVFSIIYYGFPFPNTAYSKLGAGLPQGQLWAQGWVYLFHSLSLDPITVPAILLALGLPWIDRNRGHLPVAIGVLLYMIYVTRIGGDFMSGRFFSAPLLCAAAMGAAISLPEPVLRGRAVIASIILILGFSAKPPNLLMNADFVPDASAWIDGTQGVADERRYYFKETGLLTAHRNRLRDKHPSDDFRNDPPNVQAIWTIGEPGLRKGPNFDIIDPFALSDPLLARLPAIREDWRIGHPRRIIPAGYPETRALGISRIENQGIAEYWDHLALITRGPIWSRERFATIWRMNRGHYDDLLPGSSYRKPSDALLESQEPLFISGYIAQKDIAIRQEEGAHWDSDGALHLGYRHFHVLFPRVVHFGFLEATLSNNNTYDIVVHNGREHLHSWYIPIDGALDPSLRRRILLVPEEVAEAGYDRIIIYPKVETPKASLGGVVVLSQEEVIEAGPLRDYDLIPRY